jgi:hypothetical protein
MSPCDFLHKNAQTPLSDYYMAAGAVCRLATNSEDVLAAARDTLLPVNLPPASPDLCIRLWVDHSDRARPPWPKPFVRGLDHLVFAGFDFGSSLLASLQTRHVIGRFSPAMASDARYWRTVIFPMMMTIVSASIGVAELHCACVARDQRGVLLVGPSGSGKSTLALALSKIGFGLLSDDRTFCFVKSGDVRSWGLLTRVKLRPESAVWFQELESERPTTCHGGEPALWLDPEDRFNLKRVRFCEPRCLIFLERLQLRQFRMTRMSSTEALRRLNDDSIAESPDAAATRSNTIARLVESPVWLLRYGGEPHAVAKNILEHIEKFD